jgi:hypothetical protein
MDCQGNYLNNEITSYHNACISKLVEVTINLPSLFDNFGLNKKFSYFHRAQISVTVTTNIPRNKKKQKQNNNIWSQSRKHLHFQSIFFRIHCIITSLSHVFLYRFPLYFIFLIVLITFDIKNFHVRVMSLSWNITIIYKFQKYT